MLGRNSFQHNGDVTVFIYERELNFLKWLVLQKPKIETGGDLFGLWQDERTAVVQCILGPGKNCRRTTTSFHQDVDYLAEAGGYLTSSHGLCNIGEWHSHHTLGLAEPSAGDQKTVLDHLPSVSGGRFLVFIANIAGNPGNVNIGCFLFSASKKTILKGEIRSLQCPSPFRQSVICANMTTKAESKHDWGTFMTQDIRTMTDESSRYNGDNSERERLVESSEGILRSILCKKKLWLLLIFVLLVVIIVIISTEAE